jgi:PAS domain S-box-containing protein
VNLGNESSAKQKRDPKGPWVSLIAVAILLVTVACLYLAAWPAESTWQWVYTVSLGYLAPATLAALYWRHPRRLIAATACSATIVPVFVRGWQLDKPAGLLVGLGVMMLALPVWTYLLGLGAGAHGEGSRREEQEARRVTLSALPDPFASSGSISQEDFVPRMLHLVAESIINGTGITRVLIGLSEGNPPLFHNKVVAGFSPSTAERLQSAKCPMSDLRDVMCDEFAISQSYCVPLDHQSPWTDALRALLLDKETDGEHIPWLLITPMRDRAQELIGMIALPCSTADCALDQSLVNALQSLAQHIATTLETHRLYTDLKRRADNLLLINRIEQTIPAHLDQDRVLTELVQAGARLLNGDYSGLYDWDDAGKRLVSRISYGFSPDQDPLFSSSQTAYLAKKVILEGHSLFIDDLESSPEFCDPAFARTGPASVLAVPLWKEGQTSGALMVGADRRKAFDETDQVSLSTLADRASVVLQNARLYKNIAQRANQLATLNSIGQAIILSLDIDVTLNQIMNNVKDAFNVQSGSLLLQGDGRLVFRVSFGPASEQLKPLTLESGQGIAGWVALTGISALVPDAQEDERHFAGIDEITGYKMHSVLCVPLKGPQNQIVGVLEIMNPQDGRPFAKPDQELLESIATFAVVGIQNAQLYEQTMGHLTDLSSLYEVGKAITASLDIEDTLDVVTRETARLTSAARSRIVLVDSQSKRVSYVVQHGFGGVSSPALTYAQTRQGLTGWVHGEKIPAMSADISQDERMRGVSIEQAAGQDAQSMIIAPLLIKGEPVGTLSAIRLKNVDPFTDRELGLLNMMAGQAAIAIENAHFFGERKRQITELSILNQTGKALSSTLEPQDLMELIYTQVTQVIDARNFMIALYDAEHEQIHFPLIYENGERVVGPGCEAVPQEWQPRRHRRGATGHIIETRAALWIPNRVQERLAELGIESMGNSVCSWMGVPILWGDQILGVIAVYSTEQEDIYDREHLDLLMTIAGQASAAIRNAQLFAKVNSISENLERLVEERTEALAQTNEELTVERDRLNVLYLITRELSSSLEPERSLNRTLVLINRALQAQHGFVLLQDTATENLVYSAVVGETQPSDDGSIFPAPRLGDRVEYRRDPGLIGWLVTRENPIRTSDLEGDARWHIVHDQAQWHRSALAAPLLTGNEVIGAIVLYHAEPEHFTLGHQRMLGAIASQVAISISNAEMFQLLREAADRLGNMLRSQQLEAAKSHAILEGVADGVMVTDAKGEITLFNAAAERILQTHRVDVIGRSVSEMSGIFSLVGTSWAELAEQWRQEEDIQLDEHILYDERLELDERVISMRVAPVVRQAAFEGTVSVFRDITKDVEVDRMKSEFVSSVSHELRTPMTSIKGYIDLLYSGMAGPVSDEQRRFLQIVKTNADRLTLLVNDLLDISRIETGRLKLTIESVDPLNIVNTVLMNHAPDAAKRQQTLHHVIQEPLPPVFADPDRMTQILTNLVSNAIYYTPIRGEIILNAEVVDDALHVHVQDTGIGIKEEDKPKLFSRFFRADTPLVQARSGTGLGLTIIKSIIELHGGEIWLDSTFGEGSTFSFSLPLADQDETEEAPREFRTISYSKQDKHILIIESDIKIAELLSHQLRSQGGYRVHVERSGPETLDHLKQAGQQTDLILLDLWLSDVDSMMILRDIVSHRPVAAIPILALTLSHRERSGQRSSLDSYVSKPARTNRLLNAIHAVFAEKAEDLGDRASNVLLVEEDRQLAELFTVVLTQKGLNVTIRRDADQVIGAVKTSRADMIVLDVNRSDTDGLEILQTLRDTPETCDIPVLVVTGTTLNPRERPSSAPDVDRSAERVDQDSQSRASVRR